MLNRLILSLFALVALSTSAMAAGGNITMPTVDYTDFYAIVSFMLGVAVIVMLARRGKGFIR